MNYIFDLLKLANIYNLYVFFEMGTDGFFDINITNDSRIQDFIKKIEEESTEFDIVKTSDSIFTIYNSNELDRAIGVIALIKN